MNAMPISSKYKDTSSLIADSDHENGDEAGYIEWITPSSISIENHIHDLRWQGIFKDIESLCTALADRLSAVFNKDRFSVSILWTNDQEMTALNNRFRQCNKPTDILSFSAPPKTKPNTNHHEDSYLGELILSYETIYADIKTSAILPAHHIAHLFVHGCLHLSGYDHDQSDRAEQMEAIEIQLLQAENIPNPYETPIDKEYN